MADSLPSINFGFDELRERMLKFTDKFDDFIARGRKRVLEERNQFRINMAELQGKNPRLMHLSQRLIKCGRKPKVERERCRNTGPKDCPT